jgi:hypothetical protein
MIAGRLTMRALIERDQATAKDGWGGGVAPDFQSTGAPVACFVWSQKAARIADGKKNAELEDLRALFALEADVLPRDEISSITDRRGTVIIPGRLKVLGPVQRKHTHLEAALERIG